MDDPQLKEFFAERDREQRMTTTIEIVIGFVAVAIMAILVTVF